MKIALDTLGCKLNQAETEELVRKLEGARHDIVDSVEKADLYILNTCTVTSSADAKSRHMLRLARRRNPEIKLVAIGCYAEHNPEQLAGLDGMHLVVGNSEKQQLIQTLEQMSCFDTSVTQMNSTIFSGHISRTRSFIKIQDGCSKFCSYCIVPFVRRTEKSVPAGQILTEIKERESNGIKEVVLTGTEVGDYNDNNHNLTWLLGRILAETNVPRIRLSSLQPREISEELISLWQDTRLCPHFHLSLQSGSDSVLARMKRLYSVSDYERAVTFIWRKVPDVAITTDIIVGFPGETASEFEESYQFCRQMKFARIHVFPFSGRSGTSASVMDSQVPDDIKKQRSQKMLELAKMSLNDYLEHFSGRKMEVLWEQQNKGIWSGYTGNYIKIFTRNSENLYNRIISADLGEKKAEGLWGNLPEDLKLDYNSQSIIK